MRTFFLVLLMANLLFFGVQLDLFGNLVHEAHDLKRPAQVGADRLRVVRDTSTRVPAPSPVAGQRP